MIKVNKQGHRGKYSNAHTGRFQPKHRERYIGNENPIYKSRLELLFMRWLDRDNSNVIWWKYEPSSIYYMDKSSVPPVKRKYYIDFTFCVEMCGVRKTYWVEVKSKDECQKPKSNDPRDMRIWIKNQCKWRAASLLAESKGCSFKVLNEDQLK